MSRIQPYLESYQGTLLIAAPGLHKDDCFRNSVIYIYEHSDNFGSSGLILNQRSNLELQDLCADHGISYSQEHHVFYGGHDRPGHVFMLHTSEWRSVNSAAAGSNLTISSDIDMFDRMSNNDTPRKWRVFSGVVEWQPGELEWELKKTRKLWLTAKPQEHTIFNYQGTRQWSNAIELSGKQLFDFWI